VVLKPQKLGVQLEPKVILQEKPFLSSDVIQLLVPMDSSKKKVLLNGDFKGSVKEQAGSSSVVQGVASDISAVGYSRNWLQNIWC
jgi:hypothetical protein